MDNTTRSYFPTSLQRRGFVSFDEKQAANQADPPAHLQPGRAEQKVEPKEIKKTPEQVAAEAKAREGEIDNRAKAVAREERAARYAREIDEDEEFGALVESKRTKATGNTNNEKLERELADMKRDRAIRDLAEDHGLTGEDAKKFRRLMSKYDIDELDEASKDILELIQGASKSKRRRDADDDDDFDEEPAPKRQASTARVPSRDGSDANLTEEQRNEREFLRLSKLEKRDRERRAG